MRNIGKLVSLALLVAVTPLLSTCDKAEPTPLKSHVSPTYGSPNEAWARLLRTLWPTQYGEPIPLPVARRPSATEAYDYSAANPGHSKDLKDLYNAADARDARMSKPSLQLSVTRLALSAIVQALGMQALGTVGTPLGVGQDMRNIGKGLEPGVGRHGRAALIDVRKSLST